MPRCWNFELCQFRLKFQVIFPTCLDFHRSCPLPPLKRCMTPKSWAWSILSYRGGSQWKPVPALSRTCPGTCHFLTCTQTLLDNLLCGSSIPIFVAFKLMGPPGFGRHFYPCLTRLATDRTILTPTLDHRLGTVHARLVTGATSSASEESHRQCSSPWGST
eukprot:s140_g17.t1